MRVLESFNYTWRSAITSLVFYLYQGRILRSSDEVNHRANGMVHRGQFPWDQSGNLSMACQASRRRKRLRMREGWHVE